MAVLRAATITAVLTILHVAMGVSPPYYCGGPHTIPPLTGAPANAKLVQAQIFIRHGDRTRAGDYMCWANDQGVAECEISQLQKSADEESNGTVAVPRAYDLQFVHNREVLKGNCGVGELTSLGYVMQQQQGRNLRAAYVEQGPTSFLPSTFAGNIDAFFLRSDDNSRTIKSGQALFDGLYPPPAGPTQEVAWNIMDMSRDDIIMNPNNCPALGPMLTAAYSSPAIVALGNANRAAFIKLANELGVPVSKFSILDVQDCAITHICHDQAVPAVVLSSMDYITKTAYESCPNRLLQSVEFITAVAGYQNVTRFGIGPLVKEFWGYMEDVMAGREQHKFRLYSGHDLGPILPLLMSYGVFDNEWPWYASMISIELYEVGSSWAVRMVYNDKVMHIPGCSSSFCDIAEFRAITEAIIPSEQECALPTKTAPEDPFAALDLPAASSGGIRWLEQSLREASRLL